VISWPALNLGRVRARVDASRALEAEAKARYQQTVLRALEEAEASLVSYAKARTRLNRLEDAAGASERAADYARLRFEGGVADFLEVLDAERTTLDAENQLATGRTDATTAYVAVYKALGGTWPVGQGAE
jgi:outer membrane protein TolC